MQAKGDESKITIAAVEDYGDKLRKVGEQQQVRDPYAKPYMPSETYVRRVAFRLGPVGALAFLRGKAALALREQREEAEQAKRRLERHKRRQADARRDREGRVANLRPGERIDIALAQLSVIASPAAANPEPSSPSAEADNTPKFTVDAGERWRKKALELAREIEDELFKAQTRDMRQAA